MSLSILRLTLTEIRLIFETLASSECDLGLQCDLGMIGMRRTVEGVLVVHVGSLATSH